MTTVPVNLPSILALDFDGVLCDGLVEYLATAWQAYCQIWPVSADNLGIEKKGKGIAQNENCMVSPPEWLPPDFYRLRPAIETGWEMPILIRALLQGVKPEQIWARWGEIVREIADIERISPQMVENTLDKTRDRLLETDVSRWLAMHQFYPGAIANLQRWLSSPAGEKPDTVTIITTKESRFVRQLLVREGIDFAENQIFGKDARRRKGEILKSLLRELPATATIWFVEDRLKTLQSIASDPQLERIELFLADWGYNTDSDRQTARDSERLHLLSLETFSQPFSLWLPNDYARSK
ncbi:HAD family hydrolase [Geitlerinema sp. PCC 9228]|uniref:HAD family hydrolase n=1 Tax=Geitlerinema sp. PCC 9228 TaxID=111611 RepID=UPI000B06EF28|nr:HAD family hydrolase [Geitlerinema sp. PCC 9228]